MKIENPLHEEDIPYYNILLDVRKTFENEPFISKYFSEERKVCCKHVAKMVKEMVSEFHPISNVVEFVTWNERAKCPHALDYDLDRELLIDLNYEPCEAPNGIYISSKLDDFLLFNQYCGTVEYLPGISIPSKESLVKRYIKNCNFPEFKEQMKGIKKYFYDHFSSKYNEELKT